MMHEQHAALVAEFTDFLENAIQDSAGPEWSSSDAAQEITMSLARMGVLYAVLDAFFCGSEFRSHHAIAATPGGRAQWTRDSDGAATAAACEDMPVPKDCQARPEGIAK
jgi:hypothetical protein